MPKNTQENGAGAHAESQGGGILKSKRLSWLRRAATVRPHKEAKEAPPAAAAAPTAAQATADTPAAGVADDAPSSDSRAGKENGQNNTHNDNDNNNNTNTSGGSSGGDGGSKILGVLQSTGADSFASEAERCRALREAYALISRVETPWETIARSFLGQTALYVSLKVLQDVKLFEKWHATGEARMSSHDLAALVEVDVDFLGRPLRHLAANNLLEQPETDVFRQTRFTTALVEPRTGEWVNWLYDTLLPCSYNAPEYLAKTGYKSPTDPADGIFQYAKGGFRGSLFDYFREHPAAGKTFNHCMSGIMGQQTSWVDIYPHGDLIDEAYLEGAGGGGGKGPLLVDVGGSLGHDLERFRAAHPEHAAALYLQDLPHVVEQAVVGDGVNKMAHDFFQPQPIKGARAYYFHQVLHDWPDAEALAILKRTREAAGETAGGGRSRLLIHDQVVTRDAAPLTTAYDVSMMQHVAGKERTEAEWRGLLAEAGFEVVRVWSSPETIECIIEAV